MYGKVQWFALLLVFALVLWVGFMLGYLVGKEIYDPRFFTYFNYALGFGFYNLLYISFFSVELFEIVTVFLLPLYVGTTLFVFFAIVVIVELNDWVFIRTTILGGTNRTIGDNHTGDWIVHYFPAFCLLLVLLAIKSYYMNFIGVYWQSLQKLGKAFYVSYVLLIPLVVLLLYMLTMPFDSNYPTSLAHWKVIALVIGMSLVIQGLFAAAVLPNAASPPSVQNIIETPAGVQEKKIK
jgi:hypothetical protein